MVRTCSENGRGETTKRSYEMEPTRKKKTRKTKATWAEGIGELLGEKGLMEVAWNDRDKWKKKVR